MYPHRDTDLQEQERLVGETECGGWEQAIVPI